MATTKTAGELVAGDVVHYTAQTSWRMDAVWGVDFITGETAKMIPVTFTYITCDFEPARIGEQRHHTFRATTKLKVN